VKYFLLAFAILAILLASEQALAASISSKANYQEATISFDKFQYFTKKMFHCYNIEELCEKNPQEDRKTVTVTVTDPDENKFNESIDRVKFFTWSDTYPQGITITAYETHLNSGVFVGVFQIADDVSSQNKLLVREGDSISAKYVDTTLPQNNTGSLEVTTGGIIGQLGIPIERVPAYNLQILNNKGEQITAVSVDQQIQVTSDLKSSSSVNQPFSYLVQIQDERETTVYLSWINGTLFGKQHIQPSVSWTPQIAGKYFATIFVWESIQNPTALSPPLQMEIKVNPQS